MDLLRVLALVSALAAVSCDDSDIDISEIEFSDSFSKEILRMQWSVFGASDHSVKSRSNRNTAAPLEMDTSAGKVRGIVTQTEKKGTPYAAFFGMPFAKPPVGRLRFAAPMPPEPWTGVYDATYERPSCLQFEGTSGLESEDCLYINVYTPNFEKKRGPLAVMVFVYGGAFITGSSNSSIYSPDFLVENDIVLVTFNYRLGVLGFLSLQNEAVPGNAGLKDQIMALKWVKANIASFGGDPQRVTVFGESAGSASINYLILSPTSKGLIHGAIMESGSSNAPWGFITPSDALRTAKSLADKVKCGKSCLEDVLSCLRQVPAEKLTNMEQGALSIEDVLRLRPFAFVPTQEPDVEGAFLSEPPEKILLESRFNPVPVIIGSNTREGLIVLPVLKKMDPLGIAVSLIGYDLSIFYPYQLKDKMSFWQKRAVHEKIKRFYFGSMPVSLFTRNKLIDLITDSSFTMPIQQTAALLANSTAPVYNYVFSYSGAYGFFKRKLHLDKEEGVCHGDELGYLFYEEELHPSYSGKFDEDKFEDEERTVDVLTTMWTNFAKTGNPTPEVNDLITTKWDRLYMNKLVYMDVGKTLELKSGGNSNLKKRMDFWYDLTK